MMVHTRSTMSLEETRTPRRETHASPPHHLPRVMMVVESSAGGTGRHVLDLSEGLSERGCEVHLIYSTNRIDRLFVDRLTGLKTVRHQALKMRTSPHPSDFSVTSALRAYARRHGPFDVIHGHSSKGGALARLAAMGTNAAAFYTLHGLIMMDPGLGRLKRSLYLAIERALSLSTAGIIAVSPEEGRAAVKLGLGSSRVVLVPNGIGPVLLRSRAEARAELEVSDDVPVVGFVGRLVSQKAPDLLIRAFATASRSAPGSKLAMLGSGPLEHDLKKLARALGVASHVLFLGERDARGFLAAFDVFALSSLKEGLPYVVIEAMAAGLPVVATETAGVEILVRTGSNGVVVPAGDQEAFAEGLKSLLTDRTRRLRFGEASRNRASLFTIDAMIDRTLNAYEDVRRPRAPKMFLMPSPTIAPRSHIPEPIRGGKPVAAKPRSAELHPGPGFRVRANFPRLEPSLMDQFREFATPDISDLLNRLYAVNPEIRGLTGPGHSLCGPACTVKVFPGDNLMVHKSLDIARPGDVVVVDAGGTRTNAVLGDLISAKAKHRGIAGFVVDGLVRDLAAIDELDFPVFARGTTPIGPLHRGPGEINYSICCGGIVVNPGDLIVADSAGVIVIPREIAAELLDRLKSHQETNRSYLASVRRGEFSNAWVDRLLDEQNCPVVSGEPEADWGDSWPHDTLREEAAFKG